MMSNVNPPVAPSGKACCSLARLLMLVTLGAYLGVLTDVRLEHVDRVRHQWIPWIPIIYAGVMAVLCLIAVVAWKPMTRRLVFWLSLLAFVVGGLGYWYHNDGNVVGPMTQAAGAWYDPAVKHPEDAPPALAPLSFAGLGLLGLLASAKRSQMGT